MRKVVLILALYWHSIASKQEYSKNYTNTDTDTMLSLNDTIYKDIYISEVALNIIWLETETIKRFLWWNRLCLVQELDQNTAPNRWLYLSFFFCFLYHHDTIQYSDMIKTAPFFLRSWIISWELKNLCKSLKVRIRGGVSCLTLVNLQVISWDPRW